MHGPVIFYYYFNSVTSQGVVTFKLTGQKCTACPVESFETPMWYPEESRKVIISVDFYVHFQFKFLFSL